MTLPFVRNILASPGLLDAVVQDTIVDSTIVISDVKFGYTF